MNILFGHLVSSENGDNLNGEKDDNEAGESPVVMMITIKSVVPIRVSIAEDQSVVAVPSLTIPPPVLFRTKQMSNISYSRHRQNLDIFFRHVSYYIIRLSFGLLFRSERDDESGENQSGQIHVWGAAWPGGERVALEKGDRPSPPKHCHRWPVIAPNYSSQLAKHGMRGWAEVSRRH